MTEYPSLKTAKLTALVSFVGGTCILLLYYFSGDSSLLFLGYAYAAIAGLINLGVFIALLISAYKGTRNRKRIVLTCGLMLLNVPVLLFYCWFAIRLLNTMRVTFINTTQTELTDIKIVGCEPKTIERLKPGESQTVWIAITGDCSIDIEYSVNGKNETENISGYCTNDMGQKLTYKIGATLIN
jgi:hypothetical protein